MDDDEVRKDIALIRSASKRYLQIHPIPAHDASAFRTISVFPAQFEFNIKHYANFPLQKDRGFAGDAPVCICSKLSIAR
jgi:hypothetical protein